MSLRLVLNLMIFSLVFSAGIQAETLSFSAAKLKPYSGDVVTESNGCYKNVKFSEINLSNGVFITDIDVSLFNESQSELSQLIVINKHKGASLSGIIVNETRSIPPGFSKVNLLSTDVYVVKEKEFLNFFTSTVGADVIGVCGISVHYLPDQIFKTQFD